ncbi:hypothetical protein Trydic_g21364 [Trypoxylus dichotomus]
MISDCIVSTVKPRRSSVFMWECFSYAGTGDLGRMQAVSSGLRIISRNFTFMHDNNLKHTTLVSNNYLKEQEEQLTLKVITWPPRSSDLNPIELL